MAGRRLGNEYNALMSETISRAELALLEYLHKHSGSLGERIALDPRPITRSLRISMSQFAENSASLAALGFAGVRDFRPSVNEVPSSKCSAVWLTKKGDDYLKGLGRDAAGEGVKEKKSNVPKVVADHLDSPAGRLALNCGAIWFRWNNDTQTIESSGDVLKSTPEQMSRPRTTVYLRIGDGGWKRYA
jgi:hypothetical protein